MGVDEILVHLAGASSRQDDKRYKAMAAAYEAFEPVSRHTISKPLGSRLALDDNSSSVLPTTSSPTSKRSVIAQVPRTAAKESATLHGTGDGSNVPSNHFEQCTYIEDTPLAAACIESQLWPSTTRVPSKTPSSPLAERVSKKRRLSQERVEQSSQPYHSAPSELSRVAEDDITIQPSAEACISSSPIEYRSSNGSAEGHIRKDFTTSNVGVYATVREEKQVSSQRPPSYILSSAQAEDAAGETPSRVYATPLDGNDPPIRNRESTMGSPNGSQPLARASTNGPPQLRPLDGSDPVPVSRMSPKDKKPQVAKITSSTRPHPAVHSSAAPNPPSLLETTAQTRVKTFDSLPKSIDPPPPSPSLDPAPTSTITSNLSRLLTHPRLSTVYMPSSHSRELRPFERGHWRVDTSTWTGQDAITDHLAFWEYLIAYVGGDRAGWSISVVREDESKNAEGKDCNGNAGSLGIVRMYCFGEAVQHAYLLLYLASKSRVRKCQVEWADAAGEVVITM